MEHLLNRHEAAADAYHMENMDSQRVSPSNVPYLLTYLQRDQAGDMDPNATLNALCSAIRTAEEDAAEEIRAISEELDAANQIADALREENERYREQVTNAGLYLLSAEQGWTDASDRAEMRHLLPELDLSTPQTREILARTVRSYIERRAA